MVKSGRRSFTIVELLAVVAIISILAGMAIGAAQLARVRGAVTKAKTAIVALEAAIDMYELDVGEYPASGNANLVQALTVSPGADSDWNGPYMRFKEEDLEEANYIDPWANPYVYINPGAHNQSYYDIYSFGPNGEDEQGEEDDINNW